MAHVLYLFDIVVFFPYFYHSFCAFSLSADLSMVLYPLTCESWPSFLAPGAFNPYCYSYKVSEAVTPFSIEIFVTTQNASENCIQDPFQVVQVDKVA